MYRRELDHVGSGTLVQSLHTWYGRQNILLATLAADTRRLYAFFPASRSHSRVLARHSVALVTLASAAYSISFALSIPIHACYSFVKNERDAVSSEFGP